MAPSFGPSIAARQRHPLRLGALVVELAVEEVEDVHVRKYVSVRALAATAASALLLAAPAAAHRRAQESSSRASAWAASGSG